MGITMASEKEYAGAVRDLFPKGEYWDRQFANPESDLNFFCEAKSQSIIGFRKRMLDLLKECDYESTVETMENWERVILGYTNAHAGLSLEERRSLLRLKYNYTVNKTIIGNIAKKYGLELADIVFPFMPSFFGFSEFGRSLFSRPAFFSVFYIVLLSQDDFEAEYSDKFENAILGLLPSGNRPYFLYK